MPLLGPKAYVTPPKALSGSLFLTDSVSAQILVDDFLGRDRDHRNPSCWRCTFRALSPSSSRGIDRRLPVLQGIAASVAGRSNYLLGTHIMTAGTSLQLATSLAFTTVFAIFFVRYRRSIAAESLSLRKNVGRIFWGIAVMELLIILRSVSLQCGRESILWSDSSLTVYSGSYRIAELAGGLYGSIATNRESRPPCALRLPD